jgi:hypothetical protein
VDVRRLLDALQEVDGRLPGEVALVGVGPAGVAAIAAAALDDRVTRVAMIGTLASYLSEQPYENQRLAIMVPGILRDVGDIPHLVALACPRRVLVAGSVAGDGTRLDQGALEAAFRFAHQAYAAAGKAQSLTLRAESGDAAVARDL